MNQKFLFVFILALFTSCASKQASVPIQEGSSEIIQVNEPQKDWNNEEGTVSKSTTTTTQGIQEYTDADSLLSFNIYHEKPYICADSLAMILTLWDSIISDPLLGYEGGWITEDANGERTTTYINDKAEIVQATPFFGRPKTASAIYWEGSPELPANRGLANKSEALFTWVNNMPTITFTYHNFIEAVDDFKKHVGIKRKGKSYIKSKVRFVIEADGSISNAHIIASSTPEMDRLALIISSYILRYTPPTHRNVPCRVVMDVWI